MSVLLVAGALLGSGIAAAPAYAVSATWSSDIHVMCPPNVSEGASRSGYSGGTSNSYMSTRGTLYKYLNGQFVQEKTDTAFSGYGPSGTARVALHLPQDTPLQEQGKHTASFDMGGGSHEQYTTYTSWIRCV